MKNLTLSMPEDLLEKARAYASKNGTSLNEMIRELLRESVEKKNESLEKRLQKFDNRLTIDTTMKWTRDELYER